MARKCVESMTTEDLNIANVLINVDIGSNLGLHVILRHITKRGQNDLI